MLFSTFPSGAKLAKEPKSSQAPLLCSWVFDCLKNFMITVPKTFIIVFDDKEFAKSIDNGIVSI